MPKIPVDNCCGCTACNSVCPKDAIQMLSDMEGFSYPVVDEKQCVSCGLCEQVCPILHRPALSENYADCVVAQSVDAQVLEECTSGGFLDALYQHVLEDMGGYGAGVVFNKEFMPTHILTDNYGKAKEFRNSKYAQSNLGTIFRELRALLEKGERVLFTGTPCQVAGLKAFLRKEYENLITADLVCRSVPSPELWKQYLRWQEAKHKDRIEQVFCRKKTYGYHSGTLEIRFASGKCYRGSNRVDYYMKSFHHDVCSRPSCYQCAFKTKHRCSDFTVFDSWKPEMVALEPMHDNDRGFSNVIVHTHKGNVLLSQMKNVTCVRADPEKMFQFTGGMESSPIQYPDQRKSFFWDLEQHGFFETAKKYVSVTWRDRAIEAAKPIRYAIKRRR